jgi:sulfur carrier protein
MKIILNNEETILEKDGITVSEILRFKNFTFKMLVIKLNGKVIKKENYANTRINEGDDLSIIHLLSGG